MQIVCKARGRRTVKRAKAYNRFGLLRGSIGRLRKKEVLEYLHLRDLITLDRAPDAKGAKFSTDSIFKIEFSKTANMVL